MKSLTELRKERQLTQAALAELVGTSKQNIYKLEKGETILSLEWIRRFESVFGFEAYDLLPDETVQAFYNYAKERGRHLASPLDIRIERVPIVGAVQAGAWLEASEIPEEEREYISAPAEPAYARFPRFALRVIGQSMDKLYQEGTYLICVRFADLNSSARPGDRVIVHRHTPAGLVEATVKEYVRVPGGGIELWPRSTHPAHQEPIRMPTWEQYEDEDHRVEIHALVIASYRPERR